MIKYEDILAEVAAGKSIEEIGTEITTMLNKAMTEQKEAEAKEQKERELNDLAEVMRDAMVEYIKLTHPEYADIVDMTVEDERVSLDACMPILGLAMTFASQKNESSADDVIASFLASMGL